MIGYRTLAAIEAGVPKAHQTSTDASDGALIKAIGRGDRQAMALLYGRYHVQVYRFAHRITGDASLADDIVSDVFFDIWRKASAFKAAARLSTWLLAITRNKSISALRRCRDNYVDCEAIELTDPADGPENFDPQEESKRGHPSVHVAAFSGSERSRRPYLLS